MTYAQERLGSFCASVLSVKYSLGTLKIEKDPKPMQANNIETDQNILMHRPTCANKMHVWRYLWLQLRVYMSWVLISVVLVRLSDDYLWHKISWKNISALKSHHVLPHNQLREWIHIQGRWLCQHCFCLPSNSSSWWDDLKGSCPCKRLT